MACTRTLGSRRSERRGQRSLSRVPRSLPHELPHFSLRPTWCVRLRDRSRHGAGPGRATASATLQSYRSSVARARVALPQSPRRRSSASPTRTPATDDQERPTREGGGVLLPRIRAGVEITASLSSVCVYRCRPGFPGLDKRIISGLCAVRQAASLRAYLGRDQEGLELCCGRPSSWTSGISRSTVEASGASTDLSDDRCRCLPVRARRFDRGNRRALVERLPLASRAVWRAS